MLLERSQIDQGEVPVDTSLLSAAGFAPEDRSDVDNAGLVEEATAESSAVVAAPATGEADIEGSIVDPGGDLRALISPTGVLVPVVGQADNGYLVSTPCGNEAFLNWGQPLGQTQIVIDPGHGGDEEGAVGDNGLTEASLNLRVSKRVATELTRRGVSVALTRTGDYRIPISQRAAIADALGAEALVSIHHNTPAAAESDKPGTEVYVQSGSDASSRLGGLIYEEIISGLERFDMRWVARTDAGVLVVTNAAGEDAYGINRRPSVPSALVEVAYLGNPLEARLMESDQYVAAVGTAVADGIERFMTTADPGSGFVAQNRTFNPSGATGGIDGCADPALD